jgi:hypothetical protein
MRTMSLTGPARQGQTPAPGQEVIVSVSSTKVTQGPQPSRPGAGKPQLSLVLAFLCWLESWRTTGELEPRGRRNVSAHLGTLTVLKSLSLGLLLEGRQCGSIRETQCTICAECTSELVEGVRASG